MTRCPTGFCGPFSVRLDTAYSHIRGETEKLVYSWDAADQFGITN